MSAMSALIETSLSALLVVSLKAILLALLAAICLVGLRVRDSNVRHRVWTAILVAMLFLPALESVTPSLPLPTTLAPLLSVGTLFDRTPQSADIPKGIRIPTNLSVSADNLASQAIPPTFLSENRRGGKTVEQVSPKRAAEIETHAATNESQPSSTAVGRPTPIAAWAKLLFAGYAVGLTVMLGRLCLGIWSTHHIVKRGRRIRSLGSGGAIIVESDVVRVPLTVGVVRPRILLPTDWSSWKAGMLASVLRHEQAHIDRYDPLVALLAEINRCIYWFHPLAWQSLA